MLVVHPEFEIIFTQGLGRQADVFQDSQVGKEVGYLKGTADPEMCDLVGRGPGDVLPLEKNLSPGGIQAGAQQVKEGRFACSIGSDDGMQPVLTHLQIDVFDSDQSSKFFPEVLCFENDSLFFHALSPWRSGGGKHV
jgi:hypothetical protein